MKHTFTNIYKKNAWGSSESVSGTGSSFLQTKTIIKELPKLIEHFNIKSLLDAPCGDLNWMKEIYNSLESYIGVDIVDEIIEQNKKKFQTDHVQFLTLDITKDHLAEMDVILCRDCLVHFSFSDIFLALNNFKASGSKYLLTTTFTDRTRNADIKTGRWRPLNLQIDPFHFPKPQFVINENCTEGNYADKSLALWELNKIL